MIITENAVHIFVPRTGSTSLEKVLLENNPGATNIHPDCPPFRCQTYLDAKPYNKPVYAVLREPTDWLLSLYNSHRGHYSRISPNKPQLDNYGDTLDNKDILELWCFISKWYLQPNKCYKQMDWIGDSNIILFDHIKENKNLPCLNASKRGVNKLTESALRLAKEIWHDDYVTYEKLKNL